jgi:hypothetical protein
MSRMATSGRKLRNGREGAWSVTCRRNDVPFALQEEPHHSRPSSLSSAVDRVVGLPFAGPGRDGQDAIGDRHLCVGLNYIDLVRLDFLAVHCVDDAKRRVCLQDAR